MRQNRLLIASWRPGHRLAAYQNLLVTSFQVSARRSVQKESVALLAQSGFKLLGLVLHLVSVNLKIALFHLAH